ncbi:amidase signature enzyme [Mytilinidion resinicola]|uniref:Amidase signature enzyme n=1 Tax=Mytilinidion resinicola TaxID=574789 RepID=A0A6A6Z3C4_9PEZI|nr:amidase signature enzyme [Mytilinidion resinicola]KAF2815318.1 amidase signature enzyme [Mytilinidion resinicola]
MGQFTSRSQVPLKGPGPVLGGSIRQIEELRLFELRGARYLALPLAPVSFVIPEFPSGIIPVTVVSTPQGQTFNQSWVDSNIKKWIASDDVFQRDFLTNVVFISVETKASVGLTEVSDHMRHTWDTNWCTLVPEQLVGLEVTSGPYVFWNGQLCKAYRLYDDPNQAFIVGTKPQTSTGFENLRVSGDFYTSLSLAVPSRILPDRSAKRPLEGLRFAVKDIFEIEGLRTTVGCRAYYALSKTAPKTAPTVQKLIDAGAQLVGTLKLGSLITREEPTESADYQAPFNPRGDGYQSAWSSSGGSGAAIAAYDWLDFTISTDTTGSSRRPALANGCFGIRVSSDALPSEGVVPSWSYFDSPALYGRDFAKFENMISTWISPKKELATELPVSLLYLSDFLPVKNEVQMKLIDNFIVDVESTYDIKIEKLSVAETWKANKPADVDEVSIQEYLEDVGVNSFCYGVYHELDWFRKEYHEKFDKAPYVNPVM